MCVRSHRLNEYFLSDLIPRKFDILSAKICDRRHMAFSEYKYMLTVRLI